MPKVTKFQRSGARHARGFSLIEILVTLTVTAVALLGAAGLQMRALRTGQSSQARTQAILLASDLAERMEVNKVAAVAGSYAFTKGTSITGVTDCSSANCNSNQLADFDLSQWNSQIPALLPQSTDWSIATKGGTANPITYEIVIKWTDRRENITYDQALTGTGEEQSYKATRTIYYLP